VQLVVAALKESLVADSISILRHQVSNEHTGVFEECERDAGLKPKQHLQGIAGPTDQQGFGLIQRPKPKK